VSFFVTGTDTGVGKTHTVVHLLRLLRASGMRCVGMKPICCGDRRDAEVLLAAGDEGFTIDEINPIWLKTPVAPLAAAQIEHAKIDIEQIMAAFRALQDQVEHVVVEGVGGWLVPIMADYFVSDLAVEMRLPVLVVAQNRLGCLNHTALTARSIVDYGLLCAGVVLNEPPGATSAASATNADILREILDIPLLPELTENIVELPLGWRQMVHVCAGPPMSSA
jgi:dethiobiotin synthetase